MKTCFCFLHPMQNSNCEEVQKKVIVFRCRLGKAWRRAATHAHAGGVCLSTVVMEVSYELKEWFDCNDHQNEDSHFLWPGSSSWARWGHARLRWGDRGWVYHRSLGWVSGAGRGGRAVGADAAGGFGDRDFGNAGKERRWLAVRESPAVAGSHWEPLWTAARPCRCGREESGKGGGGLWLFLHHHSFIFIRDRRRLFCPITASSPYF